MDRVPREWAGIGCSGRMSEIRVAAIAAVGRNWGIGKDGDLPWKLPSDFKFYKAQTMGKPLIMGRKTFDSIGRALPGRTNIVVTRNAEFKHEGVFVFATLEAAIAFGKEIAQRDGVDEIFINGGGEIYRQALPLTDRLYLTHVDAEPEVDAVFPQVNIDDWDISVRDDVVPSEKDSAGFVVRVYDRKKM